MNVRIQTLICLPCLIGLISCSNPTSKEQELHLSFISTNTDSLGLLINLETYPPKKVIYKYTVYDNSAKSRLDISAPSDSYLEAILIYDSVPKISGNGLEGDLYQFGYDWLPSDFSVEPMTEKFFNQVSIQFSAEMDAMLCQKMLFS